MIAVIREKLNITLYMNHLLVVYSFLIPISSRGKSFILVLLLLMFLLRGDYKFFLIKSISNKLVQSCILFFLVHIVWLIGTDNFSYAHAIISDMKYLLFPLLFLTFVDRRFGLRIVTAFTLGMFYSEVISYLINFNMIPEKYYLLGYEIYKSSYSDPTPFLDHSRYTILLSIVIGLFLYNILEFKYNNIFKLLVIIFLISASINLILVGGRIGYVSFFVILIFVIFLKFKLNLKAYFFTIFLIFIFFSFAYKFSSTFEKRIDTSINTLNILKNDNSNFNSSFGLRLGFWLYSKDVILENIFLGVGTGDHLAEVRNVLPEKHEYLKKLNNTHNEYIKNFLQFGLIGLIFYLNIFFNIIKNKYESLYKKNILLIVSIGILCGTMTSTLGGKIYLPLLATMIAATVSSNDFLSKDYVKIEKNQLFMYFVLILTALFISVLQ